MPPLGRASLPVRPGLLALLGPGLVWMALAQGSGELIWWPYIVAKYGLAFVFLLIPAALLQFPVCFEIGRYTLMTGEGIIAGFFRMNRVVGVAVWVLFTLSFLWFGAFASAGGTAMAELLPWPGDWTPKGRSLLWGQGSIVVFTVALLFAKRVYVLIEWVMKVVAVVSLLGMAAACFHPDVRGVVGEFVRGLFVPDGAEMARFFETAGPEDQDRLLTAILFAGLGGFWTFFYSYWLKEKGAGMATHMEPMRGLLSTVAGMRGGVGMLPAEEAGARGRLRRWHRYLSIETLVGVVGNLATTLMACLLAFALLRPRGLYPEGFEIAVVQSEFFAASWGRAGRVVFLLIAGAFLADTWLATVDGVARVHIDALHAVFPATRKQDARRWYFGLVVGLAVATSVTMFMDQPGELIVMGAILGFAGTVVYSFGLIALNHGYLRGRLPGELRAGRWSLAAIGVSAVCYLALAGVYVWVKAGN